MFVIPEGMSPMAFSEALIGSFHRWAPKSRYWRTYAKVNKSSPEAFEIVADAIRGSRGYDPGYFVRIWWPTYHVKYMNRKDIKEEDKRLVREMIWNFLADLHTGKLNDQQKTKSKKKSRKAAS